MAFGRNQESISISVLVRRLIDIVIIASDTTMMIAIDMNVEVDIVIGAAPGTAIPVVAAIPSKTVFASRIAAIESGRASADSFSGPVVVAHFSRGC
jgi:hypothetical protein